MHLYQNQKRKKFELFTKIFALYQGVQRFQYSQIVYIKSITQKKLLAFWHAKVPPSIGMPRYWHQFFIYFYLSSLRFSSLICQAKILIRIIVSGSSSSKLLSRLILLRSISRIPVSLQ